MKVTIKYNPAADKTEIKFDEPVRMVKGDTIFETTGMAVNDAIVARVIAAATIMQPITIEIEKEKIEKIVEEEV